MVNKILKISRVPHFCESRFFSYNLNCSKLYLCRGFSSSTYKGKNDGSDEPSAKEKFIMSQWITDFPSYANLTYKDITSLASRSSMIRDWYSKVTQDYIMHTETPSWFLESGGTSVDWSQELQGKYLFLKEIVRDSSITKNKLALDFKSKITEVDKALNERLLKELKETPELVLPLLTTQVLPIETHLDSLELTSKEEAKSYLNKELEKFRRKKHSDFLAGRITTEELLDLLYKKP